MLAVITALSKPGIDTAMTAPDHREVIVTSGAIG
jgi:hypothetical protein